MPEKIDYKSAGVDVTKGYEAVKQMKQHVARTTIEGVLGGIGSFGGMFELPAGYKEPVLVSGTDGVGTKLELAFKTGVHDSVGIDCVAMCVNDIVCHGAKPLLFLDYIGTGILEPEQVADIVKGVSEGCVQAGCALIGGETAEMPGFYKKGEYDMAGFCVGVVEKSKIINGSAIKEGDTVIGIASSGIHSNGFSLVRKLCFDVAKINIDEYKDKLLVPTKIYVKLILDIIEKFDIKGIAHITGGGWIENIPRILSDELKAVVKKDSVEPQAIFKELQKWGNLDDMDMYNTFNMGVGMVLVVDPKDADAVAKYISKTDKAYIMGRIERRSAGEEGIEIV